MNLTTTLKASAAAACIIAFAGCTDLKPIQAQIDDLKSQISKLQGDTAKAQSDAAAANSAAASASSAASGAQLPALRDAHAARKNAAGLPRRQTQKQSFDYLETDFLNMRSIFSLIASMAVEFDCAVDNA